MIGKAVVAAGCAALALFGARAGVKDAPVPAFEADFSSGGTNITVVNYSGRTPPTYLQADGRPVLSFSYRPRGEKKDTMWGVETKPFSVRAGEEYFTLIEMEGDLPTGSGRPGASIGWIGADGKPLVTQDALGRRVSLRNRLNFPMARSGRGRAMAYTRGLVPAGAVQAQITYKIDLPDLGAGKTVVFRRLAYFSHPAGAPFALDDIEPPVLEALTASPCADLAAPIRFRLSDQNGIDWKGTKLRFDGKEIDPSALERDGDVLVLRPAGGAWARDSIHSLEADAVDGRGNGGYDCLFVTFTERKPTHPVCSIRDDGMMLLDGKPFFPLGWARVRPCEGNDYSITKGVADMKANGMNLAHTYLVRGRGSEREKELYDELEEACARNGVVLYSEPGDRKPHGKNFIRLAGDNLFRGLGYGAPIIWGIGDDTSMYFSPDDLKYCHRFCKAIDPTVPTVSADVATGPGGHTPYAPYADILFLESYPLVDEKPNDFEMARAAENLDNAWSATLAANVPNRTVMLIPQAFKGWRSWKRLPTPEEIRCQAYLAIAGRARGILYYASCGNPAQVNVPPPPGEAVVPPPNLGPLNVPELKEKFFEITREIAAFIPSLVTRDAARQPVVTVLSGPARNAIGAPAVRCLLKEDGLLVAANTSHLPVTVEFAFPDGRSVVHAFGRNGVFAVRQQDLPPDETAAIQARIDAAAAAGGGRVSLARGEHRIGSVVLGSGVDLHLESGARLVGSRNPEAYAVDLSGKGCAAAVTKRWSNAMIRIIGAHDVSVTGEPGSEICGRNCFDATGEEGFRGPHAITAFDVTNLVLRGYTVRDAGNFGIYARNCANVTASGVEVHGGHDGFDFFWCRDVLVERCRIFSGDDCVAGFGNCGLTVRGCEVNSACSLFRIGGNGILVEDCHGAAPGENPHRWSLSPEEKEMETAPAGAGRRNTLSVFTFFTGKSVGEAAGGIVFRNCRFEGVDRLMHYNLSGNERWQQGKGLADVTFENVTAAGIEVPLVAYGTPDDRLRLRMRNCALTFREKVPCLVRGAYLGELDVRDSTVGGVEGPAVLRWQDVAPKMKFDNVKGLEPTAKAAGEAFKCRTI